MMAACQKDKKNHMAREYLTMWFEKHLLLVFLFQMLGVFLVELLDPPCGIDQLLFPSEEGVTGGTDFNMDFLIDRSQFKFTTAGTLCLNLMVFRMNIRFHDT